MVCRAILQPGLARSNSLRLSRMKSGAYFSPSQKWLGFFFIFPDRFGRVTATLVYANQIHIVAVGPSCDSIRTSKTTS